jgi:hypothetical protein
MSMKTSSMNSGQLLTHLGTDAAKWTDEFMRVQADPQSGELDWGAMVGWFASAIEAGRSAGMKATCPHTDTHELSAVVSYCRTCGSVFDGGPWEVKT